MTVAAPTWVLCGEVTHPKAPADALELSLGAGGNLSVDISGIDKTLTGKVPAEFRDLIRIATYVLAADSAIRRGKPEDADLGESWHRRFHFVVGVERPKVWQAPEMRQLLEETLGFLSDDTFVFDFVPGKPAAPSKKHEQLTFSVPDGKTFLPWGHIDEVMLFSGGLDSFAGAVEEILVAKRNVILVSHNSATKTWQTQRTLARELGQLARVAGTGAPEHVAIKMQKHSDELREERTQRTRSFLFAAIAGAVAHLVGRDRIRLYENGIIGINIPVSRQLVGAKATRTAHPRVLAGFTRILSSVAGKPFRVENPFALKTRTEILASLGQTTAAPLIANTVSCAYVSNREGMYPHCGVCSQCIDRRIGILGAGLGQHDGEETYKVKLATDAWENERDRTLLIEYISAAYKFADCRTHEEFLDKFGEAARSVLSLSEALGTDATSVNREVFELHRRHGQTVTKVIGEILAASGKAMLRGELPKTSLPMLIPQQGLARQQAAPQPAPALPREPEYVFRRDGATWAIRYRGGQAFSLEASAGLSFVAQLLRRQGDAVMPVDLLAPYAGKTLAANDAPAIDGMDEETLASLKERLKLFKADRTEADAMCDTQSVAQIDADIAVLEPLVKLASKAKRNKKPTPDQADARDLVAREVAAAIKAIRKQSRPLAEHLEKEIQTGYVLWYRRTGIAWEFDDGVSEVADAGSQAGQSHSDGAALLVDLRTPCVRYRGHEVPTTGPKNLQYQPLLALAVLAQHVGTTVSMDELADGMLQIGWKDKNELAPEPKQLGYKVRDAFRHALKDVVAKPELDHLVESIPKLGMRLNLRSSQVTIVLRSELATQATTG